MTTLLHNEEKPTSESATTETQPAQTSNELGTDTHEGQETQDIKHERTKSADRR